MSKNPVFGFEKPYFENIKKELSVYVNDAYYDDFDNLILVKNGDENAKTVLVGAYASENAFLVSDITDNGLLKAVSLTKTEDTIINEKIMCGNKTGYIIKKENDIFFDFGVSDKKSAERIAKCGDSLYIKPNYEIIGNYYYTNEKSYALKNIISTLVKSEYPYKIIFVLFREKQKGAYALGKNIKSDYAFFLTLSDKTTKELSYLKKEKNYISDFKTDEISAHISENNLSFADSFYLAGGCPAACGLAIKCENLGNGTIKFSKNSVNELKNFFEKF